MHRLLLLIILISAPLHAADEGPGILQIFDQFVVSNTAAAECAEVDADTLAHFMANFRVVTSYTVRELRKQYPERSMEEIERAVPRKIQALTERMESVITERGCSDPNVQMVLKRFYMQARWDPLKR
ncbi:hypothetical protein LV476_03440 [Guyparkeria hydrothermalis]|uniref:hypothetical protein n=1 Tax=Guyparkeria hydrothermalis TaxID=923 RepID=UPI0020203AAB|nr:hypothetical protein [Guyparkeria hydrothermalis]MCL7744006.1 hypothetical protein [Guyparkeria hydrothermalis]